MAAICFGSCAIALPIFWTSREMQSSLSPHRAMIFWMSICIGANCVATDWAFACLPWSCAICASSIACTVGIAVGAFAASCASRLRLRFTRHS